MPTQSLYSTPLYSEAPIKNFEKIQTEIREYLRGEKFRYVPRWGKTHLLSDPSFRSNPIESLPLFKEELDQHVKRYCYDIGYYSEYKIQTSWFTKCKKGDYAHIHSHGHMDISGVYYYKTNGKDGDLFFESPINGIDTNFVFLHLADHMCHSPIEGKIILFPSYLKHGVRRNETNNVRISLSFNLQFDEKNLLTPSK